MVNIVQDIPLNPYLFSPTSPLYIFLEGKKHLIFRTLLLEWCGVSCPYLLGPCFSSAPVDSIIPINNTAFLLYSFRHISSCFCLKTSFDFLIQCRFLLIVKPSGICPVPVSSQDHLSFCHFFPPSFSHPHSSS